MSDDSDSYKRHKKKQRVARSIDNRHDHKRKKEKLASSMKGGNKDNNDHRRALFDVNEEDFDELSYHLTTIKPQKKKKAHTERKRIISDDSNDNEAVFNLQTLRVPTKSPKKVENNSQSRSLHHSKFFDSSEDSDSDESNSDGFPPERVPSIKQRSQVKHLPFNDDSDEDIIDYNPPSQKSVHHDYKPVRQIAAPSLHDDSDEDVEPRSFNETNDNEIENTPKPPDWSYPLRFIPPPSDSKQIIEELNEKYSVGSLLTYMKKSG